MPKKAPETRIYGREFQPKPTTVPAPLKSRPYILGLKPSDKPAENKLYEAAFHERRK
jgi:hypothetical protein